MEYKGTKVEGRSRGRTAFLWKTEAGFVLRKFYRLVALDANSSNVFI